MNSSSGFTKRVLLTTFVVYIAVVVALTIVPTHLGRIRSADPNHINFIPFGYSFKCYRTARDEDRRLTSFCLRNTFGNIVLLLPLGLLLPLISWRFRSLMRVLLAASCFSVTIETIQFFSRFIGNGRAVDIDDVLLNTLGACLGFLIYRLIRTEGGKESDNDQLLSNSLG